TTDDATTDASESDTSDTTGEPESPELPIPTAACPEIIDGEVTFAPPGLDKERTVRIWIDEDAAAEADGPVVFYWHGTGSSPQEAQYGLSPAGVAAITAAGGAVIAPIHDPDAGTFPWFLVLDANREDDLILADEVLACLQEQHGVDARRIHVAGMSAGGLQTTQMSFRRSGYIASAASYSGGLIVESVPDQDPDNPFSAMIFHGGASDQVVVEFQQTSELYFDVLAARGSFAFLCDHGMGHTVPQAGLPSVWTFLSDHPFGTYPSPYEGGLPSGFYDVCGL
ncbi:MAG: hypothetical protein KC619_18580, partial [Myxococcales bacterium]|nr:hypothetical protein [Myxococcales bacterium]